MAQIIIIININISIIIIITIIITVITIVIIIINWGQSLVSEGAADTSSGLKLKENSPVIGPPTLRM